jgi:hypothetical protein
MHHNIYFIQEWVVFVCPSMIDSVHYYGAHELKECSELGRITFESSSYNCRHLFFTKKAFVWVAFGLFFGPQSCKSLQKQKDTAGTPFLYKISICETVFGEPVFSTRYQSVKQYWELWSFDPWFTVLDVKCFKFNARK